MLPVLTKVAKKMVKRRLFLPFTCCLKLFVGLWIAFLTVVLLTINAAAFAIQLALQSSALTRSDMSVHPGKSLVGSDPCFTCFEASGFATGQLAAPDALIDALLLVTFSRID
jgi:hypothetical protein